jgi:hypothetical protein
LPTPDPVVGLLRTLKAEKLVMNFKSADLSVLSQLITWVLAATFFCHSGDELLGFGIVAAPDVSNLRRDGDRMLALFG